MKKKFPLLSGSSAWTHTLLPRSLPRPNRPRVPFAFLRGNRTFVRWRTVWRPSFCSVLIPRPFVSRFPVWTKSTGFAVSKESKIQEGLTEGREGVWWPMTPAYYLLGITHVCPGLDSEVVFNGSQLRPSEMSVHPGTRSESPRSNLMQVFGQWEETGEHANYAAHLHLFHSECELINNNNK